MEKDNGNGGDHLMFSSLDANGTVDCDTSSANLILGTLKDASGDVSDMSQIRLGRTPKRVLHFCDGVIEEYSTDEEDETDKSVDVINPRTLTWGPWFWYHTLLAGSSSLKVCDYLGESLASFFGITTPKYQYEIEEYKRMVAEEEELKKREDLEMGGWTNGSSQGGGETIHLPPMNAGNPVPLFENSGAPESTSCQRF